VSVSGEPETLREARSRRKGRGKLSSIEMLPEEADPDVAWALAQLREDKLPQTVILVGFNDRLVERGLRPISKGAWSRYAVRKAIQFRKMDEVQRISGDLVSQLGTDGPDQVTIMVAEMIKTAAYQMLEEGEVGSKEIMELSRALSAAVSAQKASAENRRKLEADLQARVDKALVAAGEAMEGEAGDGAPPGLVDREALLQRIRQDVYGIFEGAQQ
jgi:hypothetical protein